jgi:flavin reductase (DIM6/NTAB) family NADH-FMN oxidoreductase RutF
MFIAAQTLDAANTYRLLVGSVVPRPIAWVTSGKAPGPTNLAPFSSFAWVSQYPAMLGFTVMPRADRRKDTMLNIERDGCYVVNIASDDMLDQLHASSEAFAPDVSEAEAVGLKLIPSTIIDVPRLDAAAVSMECVHEQTVRFSETGGEFVVGRVVGWNIDDRVMRDGRIDTELLRPLGRLAGPRYSILGQVIELPPVPGGGG